MALGTKNTGAGIHDPFEFPVFLATPRAAGKFLSVMAPFSLWGLPV